MANEILIKHGSPIVWADIGGDFGDLPLTGTHQITLVSLATTAARQGVKVDFGIKRAAVYAVTLRIEYDVAVSAGDICSLHFAPSPHATPATANPGGVIGTDAAYTGTAGDSLADSIKQCDMIMSMPLTTDAATVVQQMTAMYSPPERYGSPIVWNEADQAFEGDDIEMSIIFQPIIDEIQ